MNDYLALRKPVGPSYNTDPDDVTETKVALASTGHYQVPEHGITPYPDTPLMNGIKSFQKDNNLHVDGVMKPGGETEQKVNNLMYQAASPHNLAIPGREKAYSCVKKPGWVNVQIDDGVAAWNPDDGWYYLCVKTELSEKWRGQAMWMRTNHHNKHHR